MTDTIIPAASKTFATVAIRSQDNDVKFIRVPIIAWSLNEDGSIIPIIPHIRYHSIAVAVELPDTPQLLYEGLVFDDPSEFADFVTRRQRVRAGA